MYKYQIMKKVLLFCFLVFQSAVLWAGNGDKLIKMQRRQESTIKSANKRNKITENEYRKLMDEQRIIKRYIDAADRDGYWSLAEIKRVRGKLDRAEARLKRYKTNWEEE
jgi:ATP-dependent protease HslVU (ClpYQ) ATPase subunit